MPVYVALEVGFKLNPSLVSAGARRHAYLITAYNNLEVLENLLQTIDDSRNDIFIHIDRSVRDFDFQRLRQVCKTSSVVFVPRVKIHWGHYSQIRSVFNLLYEATKAPHSYYHLLSGSDLPIKSQDYIHDFCAKQEGKEFVGFSSDNFPSRARYFYFFNTYRRPSGRAQAVANFIFRSASLISLRLQRRTGINRLRHFDIDVKAGSDWFSITHNLALYLLAQQKKIHDLFRFAEIPTEFYVQTMVWNSGFRDQIFDLNDETASSLRVLDWSRGSPYVFRKSDLPELLRSHGLFARKFLVDVDMDIVKIIRDHVLGRTPPDRPGCPNPGNG